ncbi:ABC transporter permease [Clostridium sp. OS1-26]|uniref:ABC transporter permease n=1 Tax=Clostridium sp. OS1-26 TaxID=3070681 RepID=UPI0027DF2C2D|nr:ABC transporter permease [Clostridium sp. OS1-26]WML37834.1 ABC transporter permease [Clostridium sp. OS1-26]
MLKAIYAFSAQYCDIYNVVAMSMIVSLISTALASVISLTLAIPASLKNFKGKKLILRVANTLMSLPPVLMGLVVYLMLSKEGPLGNLQLLFTPTAMIISQTLLVLPIIFGVAVSGVSKTSKEIENTCVSLGANKKDVYITIIKESKIQMLSAITVGFGRAISEVGAVMMVGGNIQGETRVMTTYIALETGKGNFKESLIIGAILLIISFLVNFILYRFQEDN